MSEITMLMLRTCGREIVRRLEHGEKMALTYRGRRVGILAPDPSCGAAPTPMDSPIRRLHELADASLTPMTNEEIDHLLYGGPGHVS